MKFFRSLFSLRSTYRHYALLDNAGICLAFWHSATPPAGTGWVEINEVRLHWLQQPLPDTARASVTDNRSQNHTALTN